MQKKRFIIVGESHHSDITYVAGDLLLDALERSKIYYLTEYFAPGVSYAEKEAWLCSEKTSRKNYPYEKVLGIDGPDPLSLFQLTQMAFEKDDFIPKVLFTILYSELGKSLVSSALNEGHYSQDVKDLVRDLQNLSKCVRDHEAVRFRNISINKKIYDHKKDLTKLMIDLNERAYTLYLNNYLGSNEFKVKPYYQMNLIGRLDFRYDTGAFDDEVLTIELRNRIFAQNILNHLCMASPEKPSFIKMGAGHIKGVVDLLYKFGGVKPETILDLRSKDGLDSLYKIVQ